MSINWKSYPSDSFYDELVNASGNARLPAKKLVSYLQSLDGNDKVVPAHIIDGSKNYLKECMGVSPVHNVWAHICGTDLVRDGDGEFYVLEDNLRVPSGVSYMLENRSITKRIFPELFERDNILPITGYL